jgi:hypothetical protein
MNANKQNTHSTITIRRTSSSNRARQHQQYKLLRKWISSNSAHGVVDQEKHLAATPVIGGHIPSQTNKKIALHATI